MVSGRLCLADEARNTLGYEQPQKMKRTVFLINVSGGAVLDEAGLVQQEGEIAGTGLDIFTVEPLATDSPLPNVILTPHVGWQVQDVLREFTDITANQLEPWLSDDLSETATFESRGVAYRAVTWGQKVPLFHMICSC